MSVNSLFQFTTTQPLRKLSPITSKMDPSSSRRSIGTYDGDQPPSKPRPRRIAIALGDPAGIGIEVTLGALADEAGVRPRGEVVLVGCRQWLNQSYRHLRGRCCVADPAQFEILDRPLPDAITPGESGAAAGAASFEWLSEATRLVLNGDCDALVTAPIAKSSWHAAGHDYPGQTERLAELAGVASASMLFTAHSAAGPWRFNTLLATTHIPLAAVSGQLNAQLVSDKLDVLLAFCQRFQPRPRLVVAGLNPHAGEGGRLGREEQDWLLDCLDQWRRRHPEARLEGPLPPDSCWLEAAAAWRTGAGGPDGYLALYHDQGLIPLKLLAFDAAVNTTLGLPFLRTSPDHGTAFAIAGQGLARPQSMAAALATARELG
ncbi:MAG: 4-hydroxythreonine-4-phosphate dehydrogenase PdxA [Cyanobacteria bacterium]|nr:4-hydroxythreonine-4-phosphate dehydrogenase PdxA [Cyanobacteriota bacterium]